MYTTYYTVILTLKTAENYATNFTVIKDNYTKKKLLHLGGWKTTQFFEKGLRWTEKQLKKWTIEYYNSVKSKSSQKQMVVKRYFKK